MPETVSHEPPQPLPGSSESEGYDHAEITPGDVAMGSIAWFFDGDNATAKSEAKPTQVETRQDEVSINHVEDPDIVAQKRISSIINPEKRIYYTQFRRKVFLPHEPEKLTDSGIATRAPSVLSIKSSEDFIDRNAENMDSAIAEILRTVDGTNPDSHTAAKLVRGDEKIRLALAEYFLAKLDCNMDSLPSRIRDNTPKNPPMRGYVPPGETIPSRELAVLIALSMIDGSFDWSRTSADGIKYSSNGQVEFGQHRHTALVLLSNSPKPIQ